jgi:hypothetical protein
VPPSGADSGTRTVVPTRSIPVARSLSRGPGDLDFVVEQLREQRGMRRHPSTCGSATTRTHTDPATTPASFSVADGTSGTDAPPASFSIR